MADRSSGDENGREWPKARIENWGRWPIFFVWLLVWLFGFILLAAAFELESSGAELAAAVMVFNISLLLAGAMAVTWRWLTGE